MLSQFPGEEGYEQAGEDFTLNKTHSIRAEWFDDETVLTVKQARHYQISKPT
jgi:hypothetical protein